MVSSEIRPFGFIVESGDNKTAFLSQKPEQIMSSGNFNQVPFMIGFTTREGMLAEIVKHFRKEEVPFDTYIPWNFGFDHNKPEVKALGDRIKKFYFGNEEPSPNNIIKTYDVGLDFKFFYDDFVFFLVGI